MKANAISLWAVSCLFVMFLVGPLAGVVVTASLYVVATIMARYTLAGSPAKGVLMALVAYAPCTEELPAYTPSAECLDEGSGVLGMFLVKKGFDLSGLTTAELITAAITAEDVIPIKDIEAYWPAPTRQTVPGLAGRMERHGFWTFDLTFKHESVDANLKFWNNITQKRNYGVVFVTEEYKAFAPLDRQLEPVICDFSAAPQSDQEFGKTRFFQGNVKWKCKDLVQYVDTLTPVLLKPHFQV